MWAFVFALAATLGMSTQASAQACVPPEVDVTQYLVDGQLNFDAYLAAVASANAICEGATGEGISLAPDSVPPVSAVIGPAGGTIVVTASNGVVFTLVVPPGALDDDVTITMRPVTLSTATATSYAAVHFAPEDLQFDPAARLRIDFPRDVPDPLTVIRYDGVGTNLTEISYERQDGDTISASVPHFSGVAVFTTDVGAVDGGNGGNGGNGGGGGFLPTTGSGFASVAPYGLVLTGLGLIVVGAARRRRQNVA
jgi:hypothetical protein